MRKRLRERQRQKLDIQTVKRRVMFVLYQGYKLTSTTGIGCLTNTKKLIQMYEYKFTSTFVIGFVTVTITIKTNDVREVTSYFFLLYNYFLHCLFYVALFTTL